MEVKNMIRIAVCDDERSYLDIISSEINDITYGSNIKIEMDTFKSGELLLHRHEIEPYDIMFLDIDMPKISGFDIAKHIRKDSLRTFIIFVTAKTNLVYSSFDYHPFGFVCKNTNTLRNDLTKIFERLYRYYKQDKVIDILEGYMVTSVAIKDIVYIQSEKHYLLYYTSLRNKHEPVKERSTIQIKEKYFTEYDFIKPHSRYLVNMSHICSFDPFKNTIVMDDGARIPISKSCRSDALAKYRVYTRR